MAQNDITERSWPRRIYDDVLSAFSLLTRIPLPAHNFTGAKSAWAWPLVGAFVGLAVALVAQAGLHWYVAGTLVVLVQIMLTGAMHEDGLADCADGFWGGFDRNRRLEIMKDSAIGSYGVIALVLSLLLRVMLWSSLFSSFPLVSVMILIPMLSRVPMVFVMAFMPVAREDGLSSGTGRPSKALALAALALAGLPALALYGAVAVLWLGVQVIATFGLSLLMWRKIGGQTGDTLGATQQISEILLLIFAAKFLESPL